MTDMELAEEIERGDLVILALTVAPEIKEQIIAALRRADLAQTEIKGLQAECDLHYARLASLLFSGALDKYTGGDVQSWATKYTKKLAEAQARIAELEKERDVLKHHIAVSNAVLKDRA